jgi:hypothetical protein
VYIYERLWYTGGLSIQEFSVNKSFVDNLVKLQPGELYSYREVCTLLGEKEVSGNARPAQFKRWESYIGLEKVGRKLKVTSIYECRDIKREYKEKEQHIANSAELLLSYLVEHIDECNVSEKYPDVRYVTLFTKEIADICGYVPESFFDARKTLQTELASGAIVSMLAHTLFSGTVRELAGTVIKDMLASLRKKNILYVEKVYIGVVGGGCRELTREEVVVYQSIRFNYIQENYKGKKAVLLNDTDYKNMQEELSQRLKIIRVYTANYIGFSAKDIVVALEEQVQANKRLGNNRFFKGKVKGKIHRGREKVFKRWEAENTSYEKALAKGEGMEIRTDIKFNEKVWEVTPVELFDAMVDELLEFCNG